MTPFLLRASSFLLAILAFAVSLPAPAPADSPQLTLKQLRAERRRLAEKPRRIIMNNDGCDVLYFPKSEEVTVPAFLSKRTAPLAGTHVDAVAYCSISSGFSNFTHDTKIGTLLTRCGSENSYQPEMRNVARDLIETGADCLEAVVRFGHEHEMEVFWSMRMNDTHDVAHRPDKPYFLFPPLKVEHPEWLVGNPVDRTPHGRWSSVDYAVPEIRDLAFRYVEEVCQNYDVDGVELDFFRHLCYFKTTAMGETATDDQRAMMTDLIRRIREMTERRGIERGRPILLAARVPDSVGFCRDMGFDLETWLQDGLIDLLVTTGYFRLNPWDYSVQLGHKHQVQVYPCLSDSRVRGETRFRRGSLESYRGRAMNAWRAGADGLHLFNYFNPHAEIWSELGDPETLLTKDKLYFVHARDGDPRRFLAGGREYRNIQLLGPSHGRQIQPGEPVRVDVTIGDDPAAARARGASPRFKLHLESPTVTDVDQLAVAVGGKTLTGAALESGWVDFDLPASAVRCGVNQIEIRGARAVSPHAPWNVVFDGAAKPARPWHRDRGSERTIERLDDGSLFIADRGRQSGDYLYYRHPWAAGPEAKAVIEAEVKVDSGSSFLIFTNGESGERLGLWPDRLELFHHKNHRHAMDTTDGFHLYRLEIDGPDLKVLVDGRLAIDAPGVLQPRAGYARNEVAFGAANSPMQGQAHWKSLRARSPGLVCRDLVVSVSYQQ